jgi:aconitase B
LIWLLGTDVAVANEAAKCLKHNSLYETDTARLEAAFKNGNKIGQFLAYAKAEFLHNFRR